MNTCVVCEYGWILLGQKVSETPSEIRLHNAYVVRRWTNGKGIGGISKAANKNEYILDAIGDVNIMREKVLFEIPCEW